MKDPLYPLNSEIERKLTSLEGPIFIFGAGGFIGVNLLKCILNYRSDVFGISQDPSNNWRFIANRIKTRNLIACDIREQLQLHTILSSKKPRTVFNLAAYGAYSKQHEYQKIYATNFNAAATVIDSLKPHTFSAYVHAGSSSEYGLNAAGPSETAELIPNSHYAVSKVAAYYAIKYFGLIESLPVTHLRLYSAYGPWEEPDRLIPLLLAKARKGSYPPLVNPKVSRDFVYISDVISGFIAAAHGAEKYKGEVFNIGSGEKTTIKQLASMVKNLCHMKDVPKFGSMPKRAWDVEDWFANPNKAKKDLHWECEMELSAGLSKVIDWQEKIDYDNAFWNWTK